MQTRETYPNQTIVYSKNNCQMCNMTKKQLAANNVPFVEINIETQNDATMNEYITYLKEEIKLSTMPIVLPVKESGLDDWAGFVPSNIKKLAAYVKG